MPKLKPVEIIRALMILATFVGVALVLIALLLGMMSGPSSDAGVVGLTGHYLFVAGKWFIAVGGSVTLAARLALGPLPSAKN